MNNKELTYGEKAVGLEFNPSGDSDVFKVKRHIADLIEQLNNFRTYEDNPEIKKCVLLLLPIYKQRKCGLLKR
ncbi:hypothetical protein QE207_09295 [Arsenophonus nasoniae]|uniref:Uncharacterized protein n=1 Tax=Arsenophonus nasoniae TaxID=638 RepID=A0AA95GHZ1_9GAMM|nr:hypothetical protein [Arsenophonus nasoniae]WGL96700.1 hypothetical protein QE207_09295 [Arsenophonus nasoniae]